jgi:TetR/AcrR family transcriptional repressor of nem operon
MRGANHSRRNIAQAIAALCVGGMVISRALNERAFANTVRKASMSVALQLGGWDRASSSNKSAHRNKR